MNAARSGLRKPRLASTMPIVSTAIVPTKFCQMMCRVRLAIRDRVGETDQIVAEQHDIRALAGYIGS